MNLIFVRHGQSVWNLENKFTGWVDVGLSDNGVKEASNAGDLLINEKFIPRYLLYVVPKTIYRHC